MTLNLPLQVRADMAERRFMQEPMDDWHRNGFDKLDPAIMAAPVDEDATRAGEELEAEKLDDAGEVSEFNTRVARFDME